jgi:hypothetical protein
MEGKFEFWIIAVASGFKCMVGALAMILYQDFYYIDCNKYDLSTLFVEIESRLSFFMSQGGKTHHQSAPLAYKANMPPP